LCAASINTRKIYFGLRVKVCDGFKNHFFRLFFVFGSPFFFKKALALAAFLLKAGSLL
jgi:hypothetical protein